MLGRTRLLTFRQDDDLGAWHSQLSEPSVAFGSCYPEGQAGKDLASRSHSELRGWKTHCKWQGVWIYSVSWPPCFAAPQYFHLSVLVICMERQFELIIFSGHLDFLYAYFVLWWQWCVRWWWYLVIQMTNVSDDITVWYFDDYYVIWQQCSMMNDDWCGRL